MQYVFDFLYYPTKPISLFLKSEKKTKNHFQMQSIDSMSNWNRFESGNWNYIFSIS